MAKIAAARPKGTVAMRMKALEKLSNWPASTSSTMISAKTKVCTTPLVALFSSLASPVKTRPLLAGRISAASVCSSFMAWRRSTPSPSVAPIGMARRWSWRGRLGATADSWKVTSEDSGTIFPSLVRSCMLSSALVSWTMPSGTLARISIGSSPM